MKKTKVIIPALGLLVLSTAASVSGTVAWFSMNTEVTATGMKVQAKAEEGIVISTAANGTYAASADLAEATATALFPTTTWNCSDWYHSVSTNPGQANDGQAYSALPNGEDAKYYATRTFYIRSSAPSAITVQSLDVLEVTAVVGEGAPAQNLSKSLRVGIVFTDDQSSTAYIYGPVTGFTTSYNVHQSTDGANAHTKAVAPKAYDADSNCTGVTTIPASTASGTEVNIYIWFEGEDAACISNNLAASLEAINVSVKFGFTAASN